MLCDQPLVPGRARSHGSTGALRSLRVPGPSRGNCAHPVRLSGATCWPKTPSPTQAVASPRPTPPDGVVYKACENASESLLGLRRCLHCQDAKHLVRAGLAGGKGIPDTVSAHPAIFATLTAPSFGAVHRGSHDRPRPCTLANPKARCRHGRPIACFDRHGPDDTVVGQPLCLSCYRYSEHVLWNSLSSELWRRTTIYLRRTLWLRPWR